MKRILPIALSLIAIGISMQIAFEYSRLRDRQLFGVLVNEVETDQPVIALTFDDGPTERFTAPLLKALEDADVRGTFFLTGREITQNPDQARMVLDAGHEIGNHSWDHPRMILMTPGAVRRQLSRTDSAIRDLGYDAPLHFRPPYGRKLFALPWVLAQQNRTTIMWSIEPETDLGFDAPPEDLAAHVIENAQNGDIVLLHGMYSGNDSTRAALPLIFEGLRDRGFEFVSVTELLAQQTSP